MRASPTQLHKSDLPTFKNLLIILTFLSLSFKEGNAQGLSVQFCNETEHQSVFITSHRDRATLKVHHACRIDILLSRSYFNYPVVFLGECSMSLKKGSSYCDDPAVIQRSVTVEQVQHFRFRLSGGRNVTRFQLLANASKVLYLDSMGAGESIWWKNLKSHTFTITADHPELDPVCYIGINPQANLPNAVSTTSPRVRTTSPRTTFKSTTRRYYRYTTQPGYRTQYTTRTRKAYGTTVTNGSVRLGGQRKPFGTQLSGLLEVYLYGRWYTVCDDELSASYQLGVVVCRELGGTFEGNSVTNAQETSNDDDFGLSGLNCRGDEENLLECPHENRVMSDSRIESKCVQNDRAHDGISVTCKFAAGHSTTVRNTVNDSLSGGELAGVVIGSLVGFFLICGLAMYALNLLEKSRCVSSEPQFYGVDSTRRHPSTEQSEHHESGNAEDITVVSPMAPDPEQPDQTEIPQLDPEPARRLPTEPRQRYTDVLPPSYYAALTQLERRTRGEAPPSYHAAADMINQTSSV